MNKGRETDRQRIRPREQAMIFAKIVLGGALIALGVQFLLAPNHMVIGGVSGLAIIIHHLTALPTGALFFLINAPLFLLGLRGFGLRFTLTALFGVVVTSVLIDTMAFLDFTLTYELPLVAIFGGVIVGAGVGLTLSAGSSASGADILARLIHKRRPNMTLGLLILLIDGSVIFAGAFVFREIELSLYAIVSAYILKRVVDGILYRK